jgi:hypothetical protein
MSDMPNFTTSRVSLRSTRSGEVRAEALAMLSGYTCTIVGSVPFSATMTRIQHFNLITVAMAVELH